MQFFRFEIFMNYVWSEVIIVKVRALIFSTFYYLPTNEWIWFMAPFSFSTCSTQITFSNLRKTCKVPIYLNLRRQNCYGLDENWKKFRQINMKFLKNYLSIMSLSDIMILVTLLEASAVYIAALNFDLLRSACWHLAKSETAHPVFCTVGVKKIWICNKYF